MYHNQLFYAGYDGPILGPHVQQLQTNAANAAGIDPFWTVVQRHSYSLGTEFSPTAPSSPYKTDAAVPKSLPPTTEGLKASYFASTDCTGMPVMTRLDYAINFHWFQLGPDPTRTYPRMIDCV